MVGRILGNYTDAWTFQTDDPQLKICISYTESDRLTVEVICLYWGFRARTWRLSKEKWDEYRRLTDYTQPWLQR